MKAHEYSKEIATLGKDGQLIIPKKIRDAKKLRAGDQLIIQYIPDGALILKKLEKENPYDIILKAIASAPKFNADEAWKEVKEERKRERS